MRLAAWAGLLVLGSCNPDQAAEDARWATVPGGVAARPYISDLSATTLDGPYAGGWTGITDATMSPPSNLADGALTAVVSATNLCASGQVSTQMDPCYTTPNRVSVAFGFKGLNSVSPTLGIDALNETAELDFTIRLNTIGQTLRWSWLKGTLTYWQLTGLGTATASLRVKVRPAYSPTINWALHPNSSGVICLGYAQNICPLNAADPPGRELGVNMVLSLDNTLSPALAGAAFATTGALMGYVDAVGQIPNPVLEYSIAAPHFEVDGVTLQLGTIRALLSLTTVSQLYPGLSTLELAASGLNVSRVGSGQQNSMAFTTWSAAQHGTDGIVLEIVGLTFSTPVYRVYRPGSAGSGANLVAAVSPIAAIVCALLSCVL